MDETTYLLCSRDSAQCQEALQALLNTVDISPQLEILWMEDNPKDNHHHSLSNILQSKRGQKETKNMILPSVAFYNKEKSEYVHHDGVNYLMFIHNFIRDKNQIKMNQHVKRVSTHAPKIQASQSNMHKILEQVETHKNSLPVGHANEQIRQQHEYSQTFKNNDFMSNLTNMSYVQAHKFFDKLNTK